eukprot:tig00000042_g15661.t1
MALPTPVWCMRTKSQPRTAHQAYQRSVATGKCGTDIWYAAKDCWRPIPSETQLNSTLTMSCLIFPQFERSDGTGERLHLMTVIDFDAFDKEHGSYPKLIAWLKDAPDGATVGDACAAIPELAQADAASELVCRRARQLGAQTVLRYFTGKKGFRVAFNLFDHERSVSRSFAIVPRDGKWMQDAVSWLRDLFGSKVIDAVVEAPGVEPRKVVDLIDTSTFVNRKGVKPDVQVHPDSGFWPTRAALSRNPERDPDPSLRNEIKLFWFGVLSDRLLEATLQRGQCKTLTGPPMDHADFGPAGPKTAPAADGSEPTAVASAPADECKAPNDAEEKVYRRGSLTVTEGCVFVRDADCEYDQWYGRKLDKEGKEPPSHREFFFQRPQEFYLSVTPKDLPEPEQIAFRRRCNDYILRNHQLCIYTRTPWYTHEIREDKDPAVRLKLDIDGALVETHDQLRAIQSVLRTKLGISAEFCSILALGNPARKSTHIAFPDLKTSCANNAAIARALRSEDGLWAGGKLDLQPLESAKHSLRMLGAAKREKRSNIAGAKPSVWWETVPSSVMGLLAAVGPDGQPDEARYGGRLRTLSLPLLQAACMRPLPGWTPTPLPPEALERIQKYARSDKVGGGVKVPGQQESEKVEYGPCTREQEERGRDLLRRYLCSKLFRRRFFDVMGTDEEKDVLEAYGMRDSDDRRGPKFKARIDDGSLLCAWNSSWFVCTMFHTNPNHPKAHKIDPHKGAGPIYFKLNLEKGSVKRACLRENCTDFCTDHAYEMVGGGAAPIEPPSKRLKAAT